MDIFSLRTASESDIDSIMRIEENSFGEYIREEKSVFLERISVFPGGFLMFERNFSPAGYLSSELWEALPKNEDEYCSFCALNHSSGSRFCSSGKILYISSFALLPECRGKGKGFSLFCDSLKFFERNYGVTDFVLLVNERWRGAERLYKKCGFREVFSAGHLFENSRVDFSAGIFMTKHTGC